MGFNYLVEVERGCRKEGNTGRRDVKKIKGVGKN